MDRDDSLQHHFGLHAQITQGFLLRPSVLVWLFFGLVLLFVFFSLGSLALVLNSYRPRN